MCQKVSTALYIDRLPPDAMKSWAQEVDFPTGLQYAGLNASDWGLELHGIPRREGARREGEEGSICTTGIAIPKGI
jgi:hypothetical protein